MKPEPLKGKEWIPMPNEKDEPLFRGKDIKSTVEWFKIKVRERREDSHPISNKELFDILDEAFEDVVKK